MGHLCSVIIKPKIFSLLTIDMLYKKFSRLTGLLLAFLLVAASCSDSNNNDSDLISEPDLFKLGEFTDNRLTVEAYSEAPLAVGYHKIYFEVHQEEMRVDQATFDFTPMMHMEAHSHASPYDVPDGSRDDVHGLYHTWAIFIMPSGMMGTWELQLTVQDGQERSAEGVIDIEVDQSNRVKTFMTDNEERFVLTWIEPQDPEVGMNDLVVSLHKRESMASFPPVTGADFEFEPWMPSMDHGSSNNISPVHEDNGFYQGQVNFNMTGDWELRFEIELDGEGLGDHVFELDF